MTDNPSQRATEVEAVARLLANAQWPYATPEERETWSEANWRSFTGTAQAAITALDAHRAGGVDEEAELLILALRSDRMFSRHHGDHLIEFPVAAPDLDKRAAAVIERLLRAARASTPDGGGT